MLVAPFGRGKTLLGKYYAAEIDSVEVLAEGEYGVEDNQQRRLKEDYTVISLIQCIEIALQLSQTQKGIRNYLKDNISEASWEGYGRRYNEFLKSIIQKHKG